ncbi:TonB-dependent siderophore receptor [Pseudomonas sp. AA-38]|uniref:TonB-dependent siderophore receptor n=1 Tax=Pseudomonas sp. AA-38 TaxID=3028807 RepID=UPI0023F9DC1B|nr:TonB-dependent siderophore receptor [Pseudomonas sp. AA-38]
MADENGYQAKRASTASKSSVPLKEEAQSVQVVTPQTIEDFQPHTLDDALKFVSGISQGNTLGNTRDALVKRGFGNNSDGSVLRDGVRSNLSRNFGATTERVEVLKGPASLLYGALEPGGLINVISKQPQYMQRSEIGGTAFGEGGGSLSLDTTGPVGDSGLAYRLVAERQSRDYWRNYGVDQHTLVAPSLSWVGERASLTLAYEYNDYGTPFDRGTVFVDGHPADIDYHKRLGEKWEGNEGIGESASARFEYELSDAWKTRLTYAWNNDRYDLAIAQPVSLNGNQLLRTANGGQYDYETRYASLDFIGQQTLLGQTHELLLGIDNEVNDNFRGKTYRNPNRTRRNIDIRDPHYGDLGEPNVIDANRSNMRNELTSTSLYLKDNWHLYQQWILVLGGRYQHYDQYSVQGLSANREPSLDNNDQTFIPFAGLVYKLDDALSLYGNYSRSFVPNTTVDDQNKAFDPEEGRSYEVGAKYDFNPDLSLNLALFDIVKKNVVTSTNVGGLSISEAAGKVGSRGVELDISGRLAERWQMIATYAYTHTEILDDPQDKGNRLTQAPRQTASLYLTHHLRAPAAFGQWHLGAGTRYVGERAGDNANSYYMSSYTVSDAFLRWDLPTHDYETRLQLNVDNLFDKHYYPSSTGSPLQVNVGQPRALRLSASIAF